ncbi:hypothetical protein CYMTET_37080 [Cymbomonas tetramitiformis]|uniref:Uncharacterized protein n=1 Tax=Cymbomonas tetramitiformis TaxID=36881 RepID=A0AAE0CEP8_9CHLO|nr:hypothetical protein CYMTET_37080 [Cymbomonas tetramitiformis]
MPPKKDKAPEKDNPEKDKPDTPQCKALKADGTKCKFPAKFYGLCGFHQDKSVRWQDPKLFASRPDKMFGETSRAATNRQRVPAREPEGDPNDSSSSEEDEGNEGDEGDEEQEEEEQDVFAGIAKPPLSHTDDFLMYLDTVVNKLKEYAMGEWDVWCVIKGYTNHAWDEYGGDWVTRTHQRLTHLEQSESIPRNIAERIAAIETRLDIQAQELQELYTLRGRHNELERNYQNLQRANDERQERINFLELQLMAGTTPDEPANTTDSDVAKVMSDLGLDYTSD